MISVMFPDSGAVQDRRMRWLAVLPLGISALLIGAHFLRIGEVGLVVLSLTVPLVLLTRHAVGIRAVQFLLVLATGEWIRTAYGLTMYRAAAGVPAARMLVILSAVAAFTLFSVFPLERLRRARS